MKAIKVTEKVYWVGVIDWNLRDFHGFSTGQGSTYNAFLVLGEKPVLVDTVKEGFYDEMMARIKSIIDPSKIKIIISNHAELDHAGTLARAVAEIKPEEVYASSMGLKNLDLQLHKDLKIKPVKTGDVIDIGGDKITFYETRMLHWPDSMVSLLEGEKILFSNDIFGMHYATDKLFDDENDISQWGYEAKKYYANIITPYSDIALKFLDFAETSGLLKKAKIIAPDHGFLWRANPGYIVDFYKKTAAQKPTDKAVIIYDSMWGSTSKLAAAAAEGLRLGGTKVRVMNARSEHRSDIAAEIIDAGAILLGSPVINMNLFPSLGDILLYLKGLKKKNMIGGAFGSYGWSAVPLDQLTKELESVGAAVVEPVLKVNFVPTEADLNKAVELGKNISRKLQEKLK